MLSPPPLALSLSLSLSSREMGISVRRSRAGGIFNGSYRGKLIALALRSIFINTRLQPRVNFHFMIDIYYRYVIRAHFRSSRKASLSSCINIYARREIKSGNQIDILI